MIEKLKNICQLFGLHPFVGFGMFAIDWMLFGAETISFGLTWSISIGVAIALTIPSVLIQKSKFGDDWLGAIGKGLMVGVLTAIPTALPSIVTGIFATIGTAKFLLPKDKKIPEKLQ